MNKSLFIFSTCIILITAESFAQYNNKLFSISINGNYTTSAKIYLNPNSTDIDLKNRSNLVEDIFSPSIDIRFSITEEIFLGLCSEYLHKLASQNITVIGSSGTESISINDGFKVIPIELSIHYLLPFSSEKIKFLINGGFAYYYGSHVRKFGDVQISNIKRESAYGIHVGTSADYLINNYFSIRGEMKFRDPEFETTNKYDKRIINYNGKVIRVNQEKFDSKINIDGITFILGIAFHI